MRFRYHWLDDRRWTGKRNQARRPRCYYTRGSRQHLFTLFTLFTPVNNQQVSKLIGRPLVLSQRDRSTRVDVMYRLLGSVVYGVASMAVEAKGYFEREDSDICGQSQYLYSLSFSA